MENWDELRTAYEVARHGTVSGAATALGVHHATVIRHVDALEARLGVKLFQRHARGYAPTEAGEELARVAQASDDQFSQLAARLSGGGAEVTGDLVVTTLAGLAERLAPAFASFQRAHPGVILHLRTGRRLFRLEYGEAHVAIRAGKAPNQPDNVVQPLAVLEMGLYAAESYVARRGDPRAGLEGHDFVGPEDSAGGPPAFDWLRREVPPERVVFRSNDGQVCMAAVRAGTGLGFFDPDDAEGLVEVIAPRPDWASQIWLVTHVDLHRSAKVQALTKHLKSACKGAD
jgi:DNA-binding transcriptional LysR family regulator